MQRPGQTVRTDIGDSNRHDLTNQRRRGHDVYRLQVRRPADQLTGEPAGLFEQDVQLPLPEKFPKPTRVHAHQGEPCPRCGTVLEAVFYEDYVMTYCPHCQTEGRVLKDRRLSRLLK